MKKEVTVAEWLTAYISGLLFTLLVLWSFERYVQYHHDKSIITPSHNPHYDQAVSGDTSGQQNDDYHYADAIHTQQLHYKCKDGVRLSTHSDYCSDDDVLIDAKSAREK